MFSQTYLFNHHCEINISNLYELDFFNEVRFHGTHFKPVKAEQFFKIIIITEQIFYQ